MLDTVIAPANMMLLQICRRLRVDLSSILTHIH